MLSYSAECFSEGGRDYPNQDSCLIKYVNDSLFVIAIADGMGGKKGGEIASRLAIKVISEEVDALNLSIPSLFQKAQLSIENKAKFDLENYEMGTTLTVAIIQKQNVTVGHVGDTRLYHLREQGIVSITKDQTEVQKLIDEGILTKRRAKNYHRRNILLSVLTPNKDFELQTSSFKIKERDRLLLLTDGAYSLASKLELRDLSVTYHELNAFLAQIKTLIESKKIHDDYTVVSLQVDL